jgi:5'-nucleotidase (lipoprotein e(P4) family)
VARSSRLSTVAFTALLLAACAEKAETPAAGATEPGAATAAMATPVPADDNLNATLWMQQSVEYAGTTETAFALAKIRLDQALKDKTWTAASEQTGNFSSLPPAIICDIDETLLDNSKYQAWNVTAGTTFSNDTWSQFVASETSTAIPGAVDFANYAASKGVTVFYVSNRTADGEQATRDNMAKLAFPMGGNVDTFLMAKEREDWTSAKGTRRVFIAQNYRILLLLGDNFGDFVDAYKGTEADRKQVYAANGSRWGREWIMLPNPSYGSWEAVPYKFDYGASPDAMRDAKRKALTSWGGPAAP